MKQTQKHTTERNKKVNSCLFVKILKNRQIFGKTDKKTKGQIKNLRNKKGCN